VERLQGIQEEREVSSSESGQELSESDRERLAQEEGSLLALLRQQQEEEERERQAMEEEMLRRGGAAEQVQKLGAELASTQEELRAAQVEAERLKEYEVGNSEEVYRLREALAQLQDEVEQLHAERAEEGAQGEDTKPALALVGGARHKRRDSQVFKAVEALNKSMTPKAGARKSVGFDEETMLASRWQVEDSPGDDDAPGGSSVARSDTSRQSEDSDRSSFEMEIRRLEYKEQEEQKEDRLLALLRTQQQEEEREANELQELATSAKQDAVKLHWKQAASSAKLDEERRSRRQSRANWSKAVEALQHQGERAQEQLDASELFFQSQVEAATKQHQKEKDQWAKQIKQVREEQMSTEMHLMQECESLLKRAEEAEAKALSTETERQRLYEDVFQLQEESEAERQEARAQLEAAVKGAEEAEAKALSTEMEHQKLTEDARQHQEESEAARQEARAQLEAAVKGADEALQSAQAEAESLREQLAAAQKASAGERGSEDAAAAESASPGGGRRSLLGRVFRRGSQMEQPKGAPDAAEVRIG
ncbi:hypothetical protein CYMTET_31052, partial [Cymbomonas tetramitiformis]